MLSISTCWGPGAHARADDTSVELACLSRLAAISVAQGVYEAAVSGYKRND